jgi:hypothetical protein
MFRRNLHLGKVVRFRQINPGNPHTHHDAVEFPNGKTVLLTSLREGQKATVLQLPASSQVVHQTQAETQSLIHA